MNEPKIRILIIDDDPNIRDYIKFFLSNPRFEVFCSEDLKSGISMAEKNIPHVIFLDINLDNDSGFEFLSWKKTRENLKNCSVIMISSDSYFDNVNLAIEMGVRDFIAKPLTNEVLKSKVKKILLNTVLDDLVLFEKKKFNLNCTFNSKLIKEDAKVIIVETEQLIPPNGRVVLDQDIGKVKSYRFVADQSVENYRPVKLDQIDHLEELEKMEIILHKAFEEDEIITSYGEDEILLDIPRDIKLVYDVGLEKIEENGLWFTSDIFINKGSVIELNSRGCDHTSQEECFKTRITKHGYNNIKDQYIIYGEFVDISEDQINSIFQSFLETPEGINE